MARATTHRLFAIPLIALALTILVACTSTQLMSANSVSRPPPTANQDSRDAILPITAEAPLYPLRAAYGGVEGWALVEFTVLLNGDVQANSVEIVDAEPSDIFNRASIRAVKKFKFAPVAGTDPREINGVEYLFRYTLSDDDNTFEEINRDLEPINSIAAEFPTLARDTGIQGGSVWTVFHVTRAGAVQDVVVMYSSNDIFNESAIAAAQNLRFQTRGDNDNVSGNVRGDTTGLVRAQHLFDFALN